MKSNDARFPLEEQIALAIANETELFLSGEVDRYDTTQVGSIDELGSIMNQTLIGAAIIGLEDGRNGLLGVIIKNSVPMTDHDRERIADAILCPKPRQRGRKKSVNTEERSNIAFAIFSWLVIRDDWAVDAAKERAGEILQVSKKTINTWLSRIDHEERSSIPWMLENMDELSPQVQEKILRDYRPYGLGTNFD